MSRSSQQPSYPATHGIISKIVGFMVTFHLEVHLQITFSVDKCLKKFTLCQKYQQKFYFFVM